MHPSIGMQGSIGIFDQLFSEGATLLKPKGRSLQKVVDEEKDVSVVEEEVPETTVRGASSSEVPEGHVWECGRLPFMWTRKQRKAWDRPQPRVMIVRQQPILVVMGRPLRHQSLVPKAAVHTAVPKWSPRCDTRKCTKRPPSNPMGKPSKRKVGRRSL